MITNCGKAHLEGFGGVEGVRKGKGELFDFIKASGGTIFMYNDYDYLKKMSSGASHVISYGNVEDADIVGSVSSDTVFLEVSISKGAALPSIKTQLVGGYNLPNVLSAVCIGKHFGVTDDKIKSSIESYQPSNSRSQLITKGTNKIVLDAYNANPSSMKLAIENFAAMPGDRKILMIGGMMELGEESEQEHTAILDLISAHNWYHVVLVGPQFKNNHGNYLHFNDSISAADWFRNAGFENCQILVKGSRSMKMEKVLE